MPLVNIYAGLLQTVFLDDSSTDAVSESWLWERLDKMEIKGGSYAEAEFNGSGVGCTLGLFVYLSRQLM